MSSRQIRRPRCLLMSNHITPLLCRRFYVTFHFQSVSTVLSGIIHVYWMSDTFRDDPVRCNLIIPVPETAINTLMGGDSIMASSNQISNVYSSLIGLLNISDRVLTDMSQKMVYKYTLRIYWNAVEITCMSGTAGLMASITFYFYPNWLQLSYTSWY